MTSLLHATKPKPFRSMVNLERLVLSTMLPIIAVGREKMDLSDVDERDSSSL